MNAQVTLLTHFSQRYPKIPLLSSTASNGICYAFDLMRVSFSDLSFVHHLMELLPLLFKDDEEEEEDNDEEETQQQQNGKNKQQTSTTTSSSSSSASSSSLATQPRKKSKTEKEK
jgi:ribonuclease Z